MGFPKSVADEVLVRCGRHCCICGKYAGAKIELHHIKQVADGGDDSVDNCIPLCLDCHAEVKSYNPHHPKGRKFTEKELKGHRDKCYEKHSLGSKEGVISISYAQKSKILFEPQDNNALICWGYEEHDRMCPIVPGNIVLVAGATGMKKSTYIYHIVNKNLKSNYRVVYCCLKDKPFDVSLGIIAQNAHINAEYVKRGYITEDDWKRIENSFKEINAKNMVLIPYSESSTEEEILSIVELSGAEIVVVDDLNGLILTDAESFEKFLYRLKSIASQNNVVVFLAYNINVSKKRLDKRPMVEDFPEDCLYRLPDVVQFLYRPEFYFNEECVQEKIEVITVKGALRNPYTVTLIASNDNTDVFTKKENS